MIWLVHDHGADTGPGMLFACAGWLVLLGTYAIPAWAGWPWPPELDDLPPSKNSGRRRPLTSDTILRAGLVTVLIGIVLLGAFAFGV